MAWLKLFDEYETLVNLENLLGIQKLVTEQPSGEKAFSMLYEQGDDEKFYVERFENETALNARYGYVCAQLKK